MQPKYLASGSTNSIKLAKFFDKVIINKIIIQHYLLIRIDHLLFKNILILVLFILIKIAKNAYI